MPLRTVAGLSAALAVLPLGAAQADPVGNWVMSTFFSKKSGDVAPPSQVTAPVPLPGATQTSHRHRISFRSRRHDRETTLAQVETSRAPTPADAKAEGETSATTPVSSDGPHESPAPTIQALVTKHARENGVPERLASAVVRIESRFNPNARGGSALGLMQIKVQTARAAGFSGSAQGLLAPDTNLHYGMKVLADAYRSSRGDVCLTLAKYQSGHLTTRLSAANRAYCARARTFMARA